MTGDATIGCCESKLHIFFPDLGFRAYTLPSVAATTTLLLRAEGVLYILAPVANRHLSWPDSLSRALMYPSVPVIISSLPAIAVPVPMSLCSCTRHSSFTSGYFRFTE